MEPILSGMLTKNSLLSLFAGLGLMVPVQVDPVLGRLEIDLWPEYDRPGVLVIYRATIAPGAELPATLRFRIPAAAGPPNAVAELQADGRLVSLQYDHTVEGEQAVLEFVASRSRIQIEYYDPGLSRRENVRSFTFEWPGDYEVAVLSIAAQQPDLARNLTTEPAATREEQGNDGLLYRTIERNGVPAGESLTVVLSYEKAADSLSVETLIPAPAGAAETPVSGAAGEGLAPLVIVAVLAAVGLALAAFAFLRGRGAPEGNAARASGKRFCTRCGAETRPDDKFCHGCGSPVH